MFRTLESKVPSTHVPANSKHLFFSEYKARQEKTDNRFLTMSHGKTRVVHIKPRNVFPNTIFILLTLHHLFIYLGFANIME